MIKGIVDRAIGYTIAEEIATRKSKGISREHLKRAYASELDDLTGFAQGLVCDDWERVLGAQGKQMYQMYQQNYIVLDKVFRKSDSKQLEGGKKS